MDNMKSALDKIYENRENFIIIGLTGRTGAGCSTAAAILSMSLEKLRLPKPTNKTTAEERKYYLIFNFITSHWKPFITIEIRNIITSFIVENRYDDFEEYVCNKISKDDDHYKQIKRELENGIKKDYEIIYNKRQEILTSRRLIESSDSKDPEAVAERRIQSYDFHLNEIPNFTLKLKDILSKLSQESYTKIYQIVGDNIRKSGEALNETYNPESIFRMSKRINKLIKTIRRIREGNPTYIVIDAIRNPFEAIYFHERFSAFYLMSINTSNDDRIKRLQLEYNFNREQIKSLDDKEYPKKEPEGIDFFTSQYLPKCIELSDIHLNNYQNGEKDFNHLKMELAKYVSLIMHPGLITPSHEERCMQLAHNAKVSSGCISRQVGATLTDQFYAIKSIGWNSAPEGQVPCILRDVKDLLNNEDKKAFSHYENNNPEFRAKLAEIHESKSKDSVALNNLNGLNYSFCFKNIQNKLDGEKNQVHTRSLHAEENAFLQLAKSGGPGIQNGILFTTASPCELCAKKAYQIGIKTIIYIDPYPGITEDHILNSGTNSPILKLFNGAVGRAYTHLYEPILPYKDEISMLNG
jgi:dCMP deaminase